MEANMPNVTLEDLRKLEGPLKRNTYLTLRGRVLQQIIKDAAFSAFAFKPENADKPAHDPIEDLERTASPYKDGIEATFDDKPELPETAGKKPRSDLMFDILKHDDVDPAATEALVDAFKQEAMEAQIATLTRRNMGSGMGGSKGVAARVRSGLLHLEEMDESWDEVFITRSVNFIVEYTDNARPGDDANNLAFLKGILEGIPADEVDSVDNVVNMKFAI
jgi:hypothetical protein